MGCSLSLFNLFIFVFSTINSKYVYYKILPMTGFRLQTDGIRSAHTLPTNPQPLPLLAYCVYVTMSDYGPWNRLFEYNSSWTWYLSAFDNEFAKLNIILPNLKSFCQIEKGSVWRDVMCVNDVSDSTSKNTKPTRRDKGQAREALSRKMGADETVKFLTKAVDALLLYLGANAIKFLPSRKVNWP